MSDQTTKDVAENALGAKYPPPSGLDRRAVRLAAHLTHHDYETSEICDLLGLTPSALAQVRTALAFKAEIKRLEAKAGGRK